MNKRSNRVYVLLGILVFFFILGFGTDIATRNADESDILTASISNSKPAEDINEQPIEQSEPTTLGTPSTVISDYEEEVADKFYENAVLIGDSIAAGYEIYAQGENAPNFLKEITFLSAVNYGVDAALKPQGNGNIHPTYKGEARAVTDSLQMIAPDKIFINLGINELDGVKAETVGEKYGQLIANIKEVCPTSQIYILSLTYIVAGHEKETFTNADIKEYNSYLAYHAPEWGATYIDLASYLTVDGDTLPAEYSGDNYVHLSGLGFTICSRCLDHVALVYK